MVKRHLPWQEGSGEKALKPIFNEERAMKGRPIRVILRVYKYEKTLDREFSSYDEAQRVVHLMVEKDPDLIVEPYVQLSDSCEIDISEFAKN